MSGKVICLTLANALTTLLLSAVADWGGYRSFFLTPSPSLEGLYLREWYHFPEDLVIRIQFFGEVLVTTLESH